MSEATLGMILSVAGGSIAAYVAVRVGLAGLSATVTAFQQAMTSALADLGRRIERMEASRDTHSGELGAIRTKLAEHAVTLESVQEDVEHLGREQERVQREDLHKLRGHVQDLMAWKSMKERESNRRMQAVREEPDSSDPRPGTRR